MKLVYDTEGNGLREDITQVWCLVAKDLDTGQVFRYHDGLLFPGVLGEVDKKGSGGLRESNDGGREGTLQEGIELLSMAETIVCHNQLGYDLPVLRKLYGFVPSGRTEIIDTYVLSMLLNPDRKNPQGYKGEGGPHSIEAWGFRVGRWKPEHKDWSRFSPEMLHRCTEDVEIQTLVYRELLKEMEA